MGGLRGVYHMSSIGRDPVMIDLDEYLLKQEEDYIDPRERAQEILERAADDACSTWEEELPDA